MNTPGTLGSNCLDPSFAFKSFDSITQCFHELSEPLSSYHVPNNGTFGVLLQGCLDQYCDHPDPDVGGCAQDYDIDYFWLNLDPTEGNPRSFGAPSCDGILETVDQDIGGVGVVISYIMEIAILAYIWAVILLLRCIPWVGQFFRVLCTKLNWRLPSQKKALDETHGREIREQLKKMFAQHIFILKSTLVQFQEGQCFFALTIQITVIAALGAGSGLLDSSSMAQLQTNMSTAKSASLMGILPNIFALWIIYKADMMSWYITFWSTVTLALSNASLFLSSKIPQPDQISSSIDTSGLDRCGYNPPPLIYCVGAGYYGNYGSGTYWIVNYICLVYYGWMVLCKIISSMRNNVHKEWFCLLTHRVDSILAGKLARVCLKAASFITNIVFVFCFLFYLINLSTVNYSALNLESSSWSFGQIIAVTIWAPILCKYFYWAIFGTDSYSAIHIPKPYKILRIATGDGSLSPGGEREGLFLHLPSSSELALASPSTITSIKVKMDDHELDLRHRPRD